MRRRATAAALVEQQNLVALWVEQSAVRGRASTAGAAVQKDGWFALRVAAKLPIHLVAVFGVQKPMGVRLYVRVHVCFLVLCAAWRLFAGEDQIPHPMAQAQTASFELGLRAEVGARCIAVGGVGQQRLLAQHLEHLFGIVFPVGGAVYVAARLDAAGQQGNERW